jgi:triosephosphate isomerase (TIM)
VVDSHGEVGHKLRILYGGSVDETNVGGMLREGATFGFLVGRASIDPVSFTSLLQAIEDL